jgi:hypothetical protein
MNFFLAGARTPTPGVQVDEILANGATGVPFDSFTPFLVGRGTEPRTLTTR